MMAGESAIGGKGQSGGKGGAARQSVNKCSNVAFEECQCLLVNIAPNIVVLYNVPVGQVPSETADRFAALLATIRSTASSRRSV